jgi:hypothetical protein
MKTTLTTLLLSAFLLVGCANDSSFLTSPETQISQQSNSPNLIKLPTDLGQDFSVETEYFAKKIIKGKNGGMLKLDVIIPRPGNQLMETDSETFQLNSYANWFKVLDVEIVVTTDATPDVRYTFIR